MQTYQDQYLLTQAPHLTPDFLPSRQICTVYPVNPESLVQCAKLITQGKLVSFPTETVYGLGADATNPEAVKAIYTAKGRPLTDPVIVHICGVEMVEEIADREEADLELLGFLGGKLWPGPVTFIVKANLEYIPGIVTAGTGYVGIRWPRNEVAQTLIRLSGVPICAPSANRFAHISPTSSVHVFNDLFDKEIAILDGGSSEHGLESTVVKLIRNSEERALYVLRHGSVPTSRIREVVSQDPRFSEVKIYEKDIESSESITKNAEAPGQLLQHYCPKIQTVLVNLISLAEIESEKKKFFVDFSKTVVVDFGAAYKAIFGNSPSSVLRYLDLSPLGNVEEAMRNFYAYLRDAELVTGAETILVIGKSDMSAGVKAGREFFPALYDKMFRSASGLAAGMVRAESGEVKLFM